MELSIFKTTDDITCSEHQCYNELHEENIDEGGFNCFANRISEVIHMLTTWNDVSFQEGLSYKNTILTYNLANTELQVLCESVQRLVKGQLKVFSTEHYLDIYTVPHFLAFINFGKLREEEKQKYIAWRTECADQSIVIGGERFILRDTLTYILGCDNPVSGLPKLMINRDISQNRGVLEKTLLQEIKRLEE